MLSCLTLFALTRLPLSYGLWLSSHTDRLFTELLIGRNLAHACPSQPLNPVAPTKWLLPLKSTSGLVIFSWGFEWWLCLGSACVAGYRFHFLAVVPSVHTRMFSFPFLTPSHFSISKDVWTQKSNGFFFFPSHSHYPMQCSPGFSSITFLTSCSAWYSC